MLTKHKDCLSINGKQSLKLQEGIIEFENYFKQIPVPFRHLKFMLILSVFGKSGKLWRFLHKKYQDHIPCSFAYKVVCIDDRFTKAIVVFRGENDAYEFTKAILKEYEYCKEVMKKHFNKNLIILSVSPLP